MIPILFSAFVLYLTFPNFLNNYGFSWLAFIFAMPLFFVLEKKPGPLKSLAYGFIWALCFYAALVSWFIPYTLIGYLFFVLALSIQPVLFFAFSPYHSSGRFLKLLFWPAWWVLAEFMRTKLLGGFSWDLGYSQTFNLPVVQIAGLLGSYGVSFVLILVNYCFYKMVRLKDIKERQFYTRVAFSVIVFMMVYGLYSLRPSASTNVKTLSICTVQSNIDPRTKLDPQKIYEIANQHVTLSDQCFGGARPDLIVWPETAIPMDFRYDPVLRNQLQALVQTRKTSLLLGTALNDQGRDYNSAVLLNEQGQVMDIYRKEYLVPFSEFLPDNKFVTLLERWLKIHSYTFYAGAKTGIFSFKGLKFGVGICSEDTISSLFQKFSNQSADFAIVILNDGWFYRKTALVMHAQNAIMHAVENHLPILRAANSGWTTLIDPYGRVSYGLERLNQTAVLTHQVVGHSEKTIYNKIGHSFIVLCLGIVLLNWMAFVIERKKEVGV